uniref:NADH-ubiquinone oxidoreductase chain 5 n=1 Tax=Brachycentrus kozlovi TaxID=2566358 RepID=A0A9E8LPX5_9NEOP|nr:NADH dehydrogenase subunit 5 [Brachycentrus kozlovi]UZZ43812.1 NADH dehydrogenase subunit 5 [Brachycentrus kozlovi]
MYFLNLFNLISLVLLLFSMSLMFFSNILLTKNLSIYYEFSFQIFNSMDLSMILLLDWMSMIFISVVFLISSMVVFYSSSYMAMDFNKIRFLLLVLLFILSMMLMIISPNMVSILLGWDGLGLVSYCLVIYYQNVKSYNAGMLTILSNRIGDIAILLSIAWMLNYGSWNFIFYLYYMKDDSSMVLISSLILLAGMTKSAQIPFSSWLPAAMAAPTPVSALVHSSTLVTAGVYLIIRFSELMENSLMLKFLMFLGMLTMFMSGIGANFEYDLKKIIALSTLSQLGLMMMILGAGFSILAFFHLLIHAFFKSLLFLCAGVMIHSFKDNQDIRVMMGSLKFSPLVSSFFNISNLALCGIPFLAGFYSKDLILESMFSLNLNFIILIMAYFSTGLTVSYTFRLMYWSMFSEPNNFSLMNFHFEDKIMTKAMYLLFFLSIFSGSLFMWMIFSSMKFIYLPKSLKLLILGVILGGMIIGALLNYSYLMKNLFWFKLSSFLGNMWFMIFLSTYGVNYFSLKWSIMMKKMLDFGWFENLLALNLKFYFKESIYKIQFFHMNYIKVYIMIFITWIFFIFLFMLMIN